jgi:hypothetical protein
MANWIAITVDTLYEAKVAALIRAGSTAAKAAGQADRAAGIIQGVVTEIRRKIASRPNNQVDSDTTKIPAGLRDMAVDFIIFRLKLAIEQEPSDAEREQIRRHETNLNRIAECKDVVEQPDDPVDAEVSGGGQVEIVSRPSRPVTREKLGGL